KRTMQMKKIKRIRELRFQQQQLNQREGELKQLIHADWIEIKDAARLKNILKGRNYREELPDARQISTWIDGLSNGVGSLARKSRKKPLIRLR
ncbi:MAG TPA: hypothetical protein VFP87_02795, partial [Chitinophagaceae bacterium]|nr:hypothetical protein [Chitinophagaceae bacterium]